jgi:prepilin-type N-terminal cleavage/methylation domain-containing protein
MRTDERGDTLLELVIAVAIMGIVLVAFAGGLIAVTHMSDIHRKQASAGAYVRDWAEVMENWVAAGNYPGCANVSSYAAVAIPSIPAGYNKSVEVDSNCPYGADIARLTLTVSSTDNRASERLVVFVRRCTAPSC